MIGDSEAIDEKLIDPHGSGNYCATRENNDFIADDLVQDTHANSEGSTSEVVTREKRLRAVFLCYWGLEDLASSFVIKGK